MRTLGMKDLLGDTSYPDAPGFKEPTTSRDTAIKVAGDAAILRERVFRAIAGAGMNGLTADEAAVAVDRTPFSVRPRVTELGAHGRIVDSGGRRKNESGHSAKVWRVVK